MTVTAVQFRYMVLCMFCRCQMTKIYIKSVNFLVHRNPSLHGDYKKRSELKSMYPFVF